MSQMITQKGIYIARPIGWGVEAEDGKCPTFTCLFGVAEIKDGNGWVPAEGQITGFFNLVTRNGTPNEINLRGLKDALGWNDGSFVSLDQGDWSQKEVQIVVDEETYNNKTRLRVQYINPRDYAGPGGGVIQKADASKLKGLDAKFGATLRALFGSKGGGTTTTKPGATATATAPAPSAVDAAKSAAWVALKDKTPTYDGEQRRTKFKDIASQLYPAKEPKDLDADDWRDIATKITNDFDSATGELILF